MRLKLRFLEIQENSDLYASFQLGTFRWKHAFSSTTFGLDVRITLPASSAPAAPLRVQERIVRSSALFLCIIYTRASSQLKGKLLSSAGFQRAKSHICISAVVNGIDLMTLADLALLLTQTVLSRNWSLLPVLPQCAGCSKHLLIVSNWLG